MFAKHQQLVGTITKTRNISKRPRAGFSQKIERDFYRHLLSSLRQRWLPPLLHLDEPHLPTWPRHWTTRELNRFSRLKSRDRGKEGHLTPMETRNIHMLVSSPRLPNAAFLRGMPKGPEDRKLIMLDGDSKVLPGAADTDHDYQKQ